MALIKGRLNETHTGTVVKLPHFLRPKWQHPDAGVRLAALANVRDRKLLYHIAASSKDERLRLEAAHRLNDTTLLKDLARRASHADIRFEAALLIRDEAVLAAAALEAWHIDQGKLAVIHIDNGLVLRRLARSACQDAIRLEAALKLNDAGLLQAVAQSSQDITIRWQIAQHLDDPGLFADVACIKPDGIRLEALRHRARKAFNEHLDRYHHQMDHDTIIDIIKATVHPALKIDAFLRLAPHRISEDLISHMSHLDLNDCSDETIQQMLEMIQQGGWRIRQSTQYITCRQCMGAGQYPLRSIVAGSSHLAHDLTACLECNGLGQQLVKIATCSQSPHTRVTFHLPAE